MEQFELGESERYGDLDYINRRNKAIPFAEQLADEKYSNPSCFKNHEEYCDHWNRYFHAVMDGMNQ